MNEWIHKGLTEGITVDLREPLYVDGVLTTEKGGIITGPDLRIQALKMKYVRQLIDQEPVCTIEAEGQLLIEFGDYLFVGEKLCYDFQQKKGIIEEGKTSLGPWFFGGEQIELLPTGDYLIHNGYVTTSENSQPEWQIQAQDISITDEQYIQAEDVRLKITHYSVLWVPSLKSRLDSIFDSPIRYRFRWGGKQGPRFGFTYEAFSWNNWKTFLRFDYRLTRGPGGGVEVYYTSPDTKSSFESINYVAKDSSLFNSHEKWRYRFEGTYSKQMEDDKVNVLLTYDKISDIDLPGNYDDKDFYFETSKRTQLLVRREEENWIGEFYSRARVNNFQTVKQELPSLKLNVRPFVLGSLGVISENWARFSYLDFKYSHHLPHVHDYTSTRLEYRPLLYRSFSAGPLTMTPKVGAVSIFYGDSPNNNTQCLLSGFLGYEALTQLHRYYGDFKHVIEPYTSYQYYTFPTSAPNHHYIFDIEDGWYYLNQLTVGVKSAIYSKRHTPEASRLCFANLYAYAFFGPHPFSSTIPKIYSDVTFYSLPTLRHTINAAWSFEQGQMDHFNFRSEWTLSADFAIAAELRYRDSFSWRKVDEENFFLDFFHSVERLRHSPLSDRRNTFLVHFFYRFHPNWACEVASRQGWNRLHEPGYSEYEIDLLTTIQTAWHLRLSFQHTENDNRIALYVNVGLK